MRGMAIFFLFLTVFRPESDHSYNFSRKKWRRNREVISPLCQYVVCIQHTAAKINLCSKKKRKNGFVFLARKFKDWAKIWIFSRSV